MDILHFLVAPDAEHTLDDLVFAAFQGPVLSLSSRVLHRHRSFAALLLLRSRWRSDRALSPADVADALLGARCCMPETLAPAECQRCGGVLDVTENAALQRRLSRDLPNDIELYAVTLRTRCTSSRAHVGSAMLVLAVDLAPGTVVVSDLFAVYARQAARHLVARRISACSPLALALLPAAPQFTAMSSAPECYRCLFVPALPVACPSAEDPELLQGEGMVIAVCLMAVRVSEEEQRQVTQGLVPLMRASVPGFLVQKASMRESVVVFIAGFCSLGSLVLAVHVGRQFFRNEIRNPLNRSLLADGLLQPLICFTNVQ
eukprot:m51a1_g6188 hypothetical protein (317) ;mRNA; r:60321-61412